MTLSKLFIGGALLGAVCSAPAAPANLHLGSEGEILAWLVAGPFPNVGALELRGTGFATDYLAGESEATAAEGRDIPMIPFERDTDPKLTVKRRPGWILGLADRTSGIDLGALLDGGKPGIAYLYTEILSPRDLDAKLLFGSDDGAKVWLNGELRFVKQIARGVKRDEDAVPIRLRAGRNRLLFKIEQGNGGWGLLARIVGPDGRPISDLAQSLDVLPTGRAQVPGEQWIRSAVGKPGALDVEAAVAYDARTRQVRRWISRFRAEADDPMRVDDALRAAEARVHTAARGDVDNLSTSLREARRSVENEYTRARARLLREIQNPQPLVKTAVAREDYVQVMPGGRYFVHADGKPFIPLGYNHNPDWPQFDEANPDRETYLPDRPDRYMAHLKANGVNTVRLMIETPQSGNLEEPIGTFRPEHVRWIDTVVLAARKHGIKLIVTPWDTFWMNLRWDKTPYNPELGGLVKNRLDFITSPEVRKQQKRRLQFMIDRWGNSGTIFAWELLNEADLWWSANPAQLRAWIDDMASFTRQYERRKWGRNHMLSVSFAEPMPKGALAALAYSSSALDYATTHLYIGTSRAPKEAVGPALALRQGVAYSLAQIKDARPFMDTENGPIDRWIESAALDEEVFHGMIWAHLASGGAGSGFRWPYRNPHHLTEGMLSHLKHMDAFVAQVPWKSLAGRHVPIVAEGEKSAATCAFASPTSAIAWTSGGGPLRVRWSGPAKARCRVFDTRAGVWVSDFVVAGKNGVYEIPGKPGSFAVLLTRI
jgi:mannan endo-1,4-beta-mannosidase